MNEHVSARVSDSEEDDAWAAQLSAQGLEAQCAHAGTRSCSSSSSKSNTSASTFLSPHPPPSPSHCRSQEEHNDDDTTTTTRLDSALEREWQTVHQIKQLDSSRQACFHSMSAQLKVRLARLQARHHFEDAAAAARGSMRPFHSGFHSGSHTSGSHSCSAAHGSDLDGHADSDGHADRHADSSDRHADRHADSSGRHADRHADRHALTLPPPSESCVSRGGGVRLPPAHENCLNLLSVSYKPKAGERLLSFYLRMCVRMYGCVRVRVCTYV